MSVLKTIGDIQRFAKACVKYGTETSPYTFHIEFDDDFHTGQYYTYKKGNDITIHVPNPTLATSERDAKIVKSGILHEVLHTIEGTHDAYDEIVESGIGKLDSRDHLAHIFNVLEDHRIERLDCEKFEGDAFVLRDAYEILSRESTDALKAGGFNPAEMEDDTLKLLGLRLCDYVAREPWMNLGHVTEEQFDASPERSVEIAEMLTSKGYDDRIRGVETVSDALQLAKELFEELFEKDPEQHIEENKKQGESEEGEGDEDSQGEGEGDGEGEGQQAEAEQGERGEKGEPRKIPVNDADYLEYVQNKQRVPNSGGGPPEAGMHIDYSKYFKSKPEVGAFDPCPVDQIGVADFGRGYFKNTPEDDIRRLTRHPRTGGRGLGEIEKVFERHGVQVNSLANKIRRLLQVNSQARWVGGATSGRIHKKSAYKAAMPTVGDGRWNREIFKRRHQDATLDVAVSVLCDFSGSMGGPKMAHATFGGFILADAIGRVLRVPTRVQTFSEVDEYTVMCVLKNWSEVVSEEEFKQRAGRAVNTMEQNDDGSAILWTYEDLRRRPEKRKVLIVLSDGSPASSRGGDEMEYTCRVVRDIQDEGVVECYGIGIMDRNVSYIYKEYETINSPEEIEGAILNTVKRKLIV